MRAILIGNNKELTWSEVPEPVTKEGDILVEVHAAALNRADLLQRDGNYPPPPGWPEWMGLEVAGVELDGECRVFRVAVLERRRQTDRSGEL